MFVGGAGFTFVNANFLRNSARAEGLVIEVVGKRGARGMMLYYPVVRFRPAERDASVIFKARPGLWPSPFDVGDRVTVAYDARDPDRAKIVSFWMLWFLPGAMMMLGLGCLFAARHT